MNVLINGFQMVGGMFPFLISDFTGFIILNLFAASLTIYLVLLLKDIDPSKKLSKAEIADLAFKVSSSAELASETGIEEREADQILATLDTLREKEKELSDFMDSLSETGLLDHGSREKVEKIKGGIESCFNEFRKGSFEAARKKLEKIMREIDKIREALEFKDLMEFKKSLDERMAVLPQIEPLRREYEKVILEYEKIRRVALKGNFERFNSLKGRLKGVLDGFSGLVDEAERLQRSLTQLEDKNQVLREKLDELKEWNPVELKEKQIKAEKEIADLKEKLKFSMPKELVSDLEKIRSYISSLDGEVSETLRVISQWDRYSERIGRLLDGWRKVTPDMLIGVPEWLKPRLLLKYFEEHLTEPIILRDGLLEAPPIPFFKVKPVKEEEKREELTEMERRFYGYIVAKNGVYSRKEAADLLNLTVEEIEKLEENLRRKGYIE